jgi:hypothetical protein
MVVLNLVELMELDAMNDVYLTHCQEYRHFVVMMMMKLLAWHANPMHYHVVGFPRPAMALTKIV